MLLLRYFAAILLLVPFLVRTTSAVDRPNIVVIVADDLGWNDVGYHNDEIRSPHMDELVATGVNLDMHYVQPQCTPTRVALMTGRYPSRFGPHCTTASNERALPFGTMTMASLLKANGYATALIGKWHLGSLPEWGPNHFGFDYAYGSLAGAVGMYDHRYRLTNPRFTQTWHRNGEFIEEVGHATDLTASEAVQWIEAHQNEPFFLYVPFHAVHVPLVEETKWLEPNEHIRRTDRKLFAAAVTHLDAAIGRIVDVLEKRGLRQKTLIVFTSDNGGLNNHRGNTYPPPDPQVTDFSSNLPLRGQKTETYEGGIRVPAFANWPGRLEPRTLPAPMHVVDWLPTVADLLGIELDEDPAWDGQSVWPMLKGEQPAPRQRTLYWVWGGRGRRAALRHGDWKIVRMGQDAPWELFHVGQDPHETADLASKNPDKLQEMRALFAAEQSKDAPPNLIGD